MSVGREESREKDGDDDRPKDDGKNGDTGCKPNAAVLVGNCNPKLIPLGTLNVGI